MATVYIAPTAQGLEDGTSAAKPLKIHIHRYRRNRCGKWWYHRVCGRNLQFSNSLGFSVRYHLRSKLPTTNHKWCKMDHTSAYW